LWPCDNVGPVNFTVVSHRKSFLVACCSVGLIALTVFAGEFPDSWTWDKDPKNREAHAALEGKPMPALDPSGWINGEVKAADMKGKVVVVDFYATWCGPCMAAIPHNNELLKKYKDKGLVSLASALPIAVRRRWQRW
jgi:thiol-disulfide isomerase/thioredoxin